MSTITGSNPVTGTTQPDATVAAEQAAKDAARAAADAVKVGKRMDATFVKSLATAATAINGVAVAMHNCKTPVAEGQPAPWQLVTDENGEPFASWQKYLAVRLSAHTFLHKIVRDPVIELLLAEGMSIRAAAEATNSSVGTVAGVKKAAETRAARPGGDTAGVASTPAAIASKKLTAFLNASSKVRDAIPDMSESEHEKLDIDLRETLKVLTELVQLRAHVTAVRAREAEAQQKQQGTAKPGPKPAPKVTAAA